MSIRANLDFGLIGLNVGDNLVLNPAAPVTRVSISAMSIFNSSVTTVLVSLYESDDLTSASGTEIERISIDAGQQRDVLGLIGQVVNANKNIIAVADATGCSVKTSGIEYRGTS